MRSEMIPCPRRQVSVRPCMPTCVLVRPPLVARHRGTWLSQANTVSLLRLFTIASRVGGATPSFSSTEAPAYSSTLSGLLNSLNSDASDAWDASGMDEADGVPDDGNASMAGDDCQRPQSLFPDSKARAAPVEKQKAGSHRTSVVKSQVCVCVCVCVICIYVIRM